MKFRLLKPMFLIALVFLGTYALSVEASGAYACSNEGYTIFTVNGIRTDKTGAFDNSFALRRELPQQYKGEKLVVNYIYNPTHLAGIGDIFDAIRQGVFDDEDLPDYDLTEMLTDASHRIRTQKVLLVGHSQGNFYTNSFYKAVADQAGGIPKQSLGVYAVATPSDHVAGNGRYVTSDTDKVIAGVVGHLPFKKILKPMDHISLQEGDDVYGHSFSDVYLKYLSPKIISDIDWSLDQLTSNTIQNNNAACIAPPKITLGHQIQKEFLSISDTVASVVADGIDSAVSAVSSGVRTVFSSASSVVQSTLGRAEIGAGKNGASALEAVSSPESIADNVVIPKTGSQTQVSSGLSVPSVIENPTQSSIQNNPIQNEIPPIQPPAVIVPISAPAENTNLEPSSSSTSSNLPISSGGGNTATGQSQGQPASQTQAPDESQNQTPSPDQTQTPVQTPPVDDTPPVIPVPDPVPVAPVTPPVITIIGDTSTSIQKNSTYTDPGATALDSAGMPITVTSVSTVNPAVPGTYTITYTATDAAGNITTIIRTVYVNGIKKYFDAANKISYTGNFLVCNVDTHSVYTGGSNSGLTFVSDSNWQTSQMKTQNTNMPIGTNFRFIFSNDKQATSDCTGATYIHDYSDTFHYQTSLGSSVIADNAKIITSFTITSLSPAVVGIITDATHSIIIAVPVGTDITHLVPHIVVSPGAIIDPESDVSGDFTNTVTYVVVARDDSTQAYTAHIVPQGAQLSFDANNTIPYQGSFIVCNMDAHLLIASGNNSTLTNFISSTSWETAYEATPNPNMAINTNFRFIFGDVSIAKSDCAQGTYLDSYSNTFYYTTVSGSSVVYGVYVPRVLSSAKAIMSFGFAGLTPSVSGTISESDHSIAASVPFGTDVKTLVPTITVSSASSITPNTNTAEDFTNPVSYTVTAEDGSTQVYVVTVAVEPDPNSAPVLDTTAPPTITSYTFNGVTDNITINPVVNNLTIALVANKDVNWLSVKIESESDTSFYRIFQSGPLCVDGTATCTKTWDGVLSSGGLLHNGIFRVRVHIKDADGNDYEQYLPSTITVSGAPDDGE